LRCGSLSGGFNTFDADPGRRRRTWRGAWKVKFVRTIGGNAGQRECDVNEAGN